MLKHNLITLLFLALMGISNSTLAEKPLSPLTTSVENFKDFPDWEIVNQSYYRAIAYHPDGKVIASGSRDNTIQLWDSQNGEIVNILKGHAGSITSLAYSPNGEIIASGSGDNTVKLWSTQSGIAVKVLKGHSSSVSTVAYSPNGKIIASGSDDNTIKLWDTASGKTIKTLKGHLSSVSAIAYSPNGNVIASGSTDNTIRLWDTRSGKSLKVLKGHATTVSAIAYNPNGESIASGSRESNIRIWNTKSGENIKTLKGHTGIVRAIAYSPDGKVIISGSDGGRRITYTSDFSATTDIGDPTEPISLSEAIILWNAESGKVITMLNEPSNSVLAITYSPDGKIIASISNEAIRLWSAQSGETVNILQGSQPNIVYPMTYSPDGDYIASSIRDNTIRLWNAQSGEAVDLLQGSSSPISAIKFSPKGTFMASGSEDGKIILWRAKSLKIESVINSSFSSVKSMAYSPDGVQLATGHEDQKIRFWNTKSAALEETLDVKSNSFPSLAYNPTDKNSFAYISGDSSIILRDLKSGKDTKTLSREISSIAFSPDGKFIASGSRTGIVEIWDSRTGILLNSLEGHADTIFAISYKLGGKVIASASSDKTIRVWNVQSGKLINVLVGHTSAVNQLIFSPSGKTLASGSFDGSIKLWKISNRQPIKTLVSGTNGNWISYDESGNFNRGDDGSMLLIRKHGKLRPAVPKTIKTDNTKTLSISYDEQEIVLDGINPATINIKVQNNSLYPVIWIKPKLISSRKLTIYDNPSVLHLDSGQNALLRIKIAAHLPHQLTTASAKENELITSRQETLKLQLIAPEQTKSNIISIPLKLNSPRLELLKSELTNNVLTVSIYNSGKLAVANTRFNLEIPGENRLDEQIVNSLIKPGDIIERAFILPKGFKFKDDGKINFQVTTANLPFFIWDFDNHPVHLKSSLWWIYLGLLLPITLITIFALYKKRYQHPMVIELSETPLALLNMPFESLDEAQRKLTQTSRLDNVLSGVGVSSRTLSSAVTFAELNIAGKEQLITKRLGAKAELVQTIPSDATDMSIYQLTLTEGFPLNIDRLLLCFPEQTASEDVFSALKHLPETQTRVSLIMGNDSEYQRKLLSKTSDTSNKWVAPQGSEITRLLLAPDAETTLAEILSGQLSLQQISPYRIGGGVNNESVFFGRRELISQIINRDPANYLMAGGRQVGKSTLLKAIERRYEDNPQVECVYLTLSSEVLVPRLASLLKLERTNNAEVLAAQLDERIHESGQRFVFLIDEADRFISQEKAQDYAILNAFRRLSEEGNCTFILAGFWQLYQHAVLDYQSPIRNFGELLSVGELEKPACVELVTQPMKTMNLSYANEILVEHITDSCGQRANLIAIACQHIVRNLPPKQRVIEAGDVDKALRSDELRRALSGWVVGETDHEQAYERMVVYATIGMPSFTTGDLLELAKQNGVAVDTLMLDRTLSRLELAFVLRRKDGRWFYRVPLFVDYIAEDSPELKLQAELSRIGQYG